MPDISVQIKKLPYFILKYGVSCLWSLLLSFPESACHVFHGLMNLSITPGCAVVFPIALQIRCHSD